MTDIGTEHFNYYASGIFTIGSSEFMRLTSPTRPMTFVLVSEKTGIKIPFKYQWTNKVLEEFYAPIKELVDPSLISLRFVVTYHEPKSKLLVPSIRKR